MPDTRKVAIIANPAEKGDDRKVEITVTKQVTNVHIMSVKQIKERVAQIDQQIADLQAERAQITSDSTTAGVDLTK